MTEIAPWITADMVRNGQRRSGIYLTANDAQTILGQLDQPGTYAKHEPRVAVAPWDGKPVNGVDMRKHEGMPQQGTKVLLDGKLTTMQPQVREEAKPKNTSHQFLTRDQGLAHTTYIDGKLVGFQPHAPLPGWHALTSKAVPCPACSKTHEACPTCGKEHDIAEAMEAQRVSIVQSLASQELQTRILYLAQEIQDRRMEALDRLAASGAGK